MIVELASLMAALAASESDDDTVGPVSNSIGLGSRGGGGGAPPTFEDKIVAIFTQNLMETAAHLILNGEEAHPHIFLFRKTPEGELDLKISPLLMDKEFWPDVFTAAVISSGAVAYGFIGESWMTLVEAEKRVEVLNGFLFLTEQIRVYLREISADRRSLGPPIEMPRGEGITRFPSMKKITIVANSYTGRRKAMKAPKIWNG